MMKFLGFLIIGFITFSCATKKTAIHELNWLSGDWTAQYHGRTITETWQLQGDSIWIGKTSIVRDGQFFMTEEMSIHFEDGKYVFCTSVKEQNEGLEVVYSEKEHTKNRIVFENSAHDFPQLITYELKNDKELEAFISGENEGKEMRIDFKYKRVK